MWDAGTVTIPVSQMNKQVAQRLSNLPQISLIDRNGDFNPRAYVSKAFKSPVSWCYAQPALFTSTGQVSNLDIMELDQGETREKNLLSREVQPSIFSLLSRNEVLT